MQKPSYRRGFLTEEDLRDGNTFIVLPGHVQAPRLSRGRGRQEEAPSQTKGRMSPREGWPDELHPLGDN